MFFCFFLPPYIVMYLHISLNSKNNSKTGNFTCNTVCEIFTSFTHSLEKIIQKSFLFENMWFFNRPSAHFYKTEILTRKIKVTILLSVVHFFVLTQWTMFIREVLNFIHKTQILKEIHVTIKIIYFFPSAQFLQTVWYLKMPIRKYKIRGHVSLFP